MSAKTTIPGYSGYIPNYQTEYPLNKGVTAHKYEDINPEERTLYTDSPWRTMYTSTVDPLTTRRQPPMVEQQNTQQINPNTTVVKSFKRIAGRREKMEETRNQNEYETRPTTNWGTTYNMQFNGWKMDMTARERQSRARSAPLPHGVSADYRQGDQLSSTVLQGPDQKSSYGRSFGGRNDNPRHHYVEPDGKAVFSRRSTTNDLFAGTNKGSVRIPSYAGYVPASRNNINTIRNNIRRENKANLIDTYRHAMPGYTGKAAGQRPW